jgi:hypothetical protein
MRFYPNFALTEHCQTSASMRKPPCDGSQRNLHDDVSTDDVHMMICSTRREIPHHLPCHTPHLNLGN